jgi:hypothetical protein
MTSEGIKTVFKGNILDNTIIEGRSLRAYNQYLPMGRFWRLQDNKLIFEAKFEDVLEKRFFTDTIVMVQCMANESLKMENRSAIQLGEELLTTENF